MTQRGPCNDPFPEASFGSSGTAIVNYPEQVTASASEKVRFQVEISKDRLGQIEDLGARCGIESRKGIFDAAITLLDWAVSEVEAGKDIAAVNREKEEFEILRMIELTTAARRARAAAGR